jgi:hypothetical protein
MRCGKTLSGYARAPRRCLRVLCEDPLSPSEVPGVSQLQLSSFGASSILLFKAAGTLRYASKIAPYLVCASSHTVLFPDALSNVRGRLRPTLE